MTTSWRTAEKHVAWSNFWVRVFLKSNTGIYICVLYVCVYIHVCMCVNIYVTMYVWIYACLLYVGMCIYVCVNWRFFHNFHEEDQMKWAKCNLFFRNGVCWSLVLPQRIHDLKVFLCVNQVYANLHQGASSHDQFCELLISGSSVAYMLLVAWAMCNTRFFCVSCWGVCCLPWRLLALKKHINKLNLRAAQELRKSN